MHTKKVFTLAAVVALSGAFFSSNALGAPEDPTRAPNLKTEWITSLKVGAGTAGMTCGTSFKAGFAITNTKSAAASGTITVGSVVTPFTVAGGQTLQALTNNENITECRHATNVPAVVKDSSGRDIARSTFKPNVLTTSYFKGDAGGASFAMDVEAKAGSPIAFKAQVKGGTTPYSGNVKVTYGATSKTVALTAAPSETKSSAIPMPSLDATNIADMTFTFTPGPSGTLTPKSLSFAEDRTFTYE